jgi:hypothetical protein
MMNPEIPLRANSLIALLVAVHMTLGTAAAPAIGVVTATGEFRLNGTGVEGRANLADGADVDTGATAATLRLASGAQVDLALHSRSRVFRNRAILEGGASQFAAPSGFTLEARSLRVTPLSPNASGQAALAGSNHVQLAAVTGLWRVMNDRGVIVADMAPGTTLDLQLPEKAPDTSPDATASKMKGCLRKKDGHYLLKDETTNVTAELQAIDPKTLEDEVKHHIEIAGSMVAGTTPVKGATQLIQVSELKRLSKRCGFPGGMLAGTGIASAAVIAGIIIGTGAAIGTIVAVTSTPGTPVSPTVP